MNKFCQKTISEEIKLKGIGLHNGQKVNLTIIPAEANTGIIFKRTDIKTENTIRADFKNVIEPVLCTKLKNKME